MFGLSFNNLYIVYVVCAWPSLMDKISLFQISFNVCVIHEMNYSLVLCILFMNFYLAKVFFSKIKQKKISLFFCWKNLYFKFEFFSIKTIISIIHSLSLRKCCLLQGGENERAKKKKKKKDHLHKDLIMLTSEPVLCV